MLSKSLSTSLSSREPSQSQAILAAVARRARQVGRGLTRQELCQVLAEVTGGTP